MAFGIDGVYTRVGSIDPRVADGLAEPLTACGLSRTCLSTVEAVSGCVPTNKSYLRTAVRISGRGFPLHAPRLHALSAPACCPVDAFTFSTDPLHRSPLTPLTRS